MHCREKDRLISPQPMNDPDLWTYPVVDQSVGYKTGYKRGKVRVYFGRKSRLKSDFFEKNRGSEVTFSRKIEFCSERPASILRSRGLKFMQSVAGIEVSLCGKLGVSIVFWSREMSGRSWSKNAFFRPMLTLWGKATVDLLRLKFLRHVDLS